MRRSRTGGGSDTPAGDNPRSAPHVKFFSVECEPVRSRRRRRRRRRHYRGGRSSGRPGQRPYRACPSRRCGPHAPHRPPAPPRPRRSLEAERHAATTPIATTPVLAPGAGDRLLTPIERMGAFPPRPGTLERHLRAKGAAGAHSRRPPPEISCHRPARARRPAASASVALAGVISKRLGTLDSPLGLFRARDQSRVLSFFRRLFTASEEQPSRRRCSPPRPRQTSAIGAPCRRDQL